MAHLLSIVESLSCWIAVRLCVVHLERCIHRILEPNIHCNNMMYNGVILVGFQGRRDGEIRCSVAIEDVHQFGLLHSTYHNCTSLRVHSEVLPWHDSTCTRLPECFLVELIERVRLREVLNNDNAARVRSQNGIVLFHSGARQQEILVSHGSRLELLRADANGKLSTVLAQDAFGSIRSMTSFRLTGGTKGKLFLPSNFHSHVTHR